MAMGMVSAVAMAKLILSAKLILFSSPGDPRLQDALLPRRAPWSWRNLQVGLALECESPLQRNS